MGVVKVVASKTGANREGLKASLNYIFRQDKSEKEYRAVTGPFEGDVEPKAVFDAFVKEQEQWDKTAGRTYAHYVLSWHKDEHITKQQALDKEIEKIKGAAIQNENSQNSPFSNNVLGSIK